MSLNFDLWLILLRSQLIDNSSTASFRTPSLWDMFSLTRQCRIVTLVARKFPVATNSCDMVSAQALQCTNHRFLVAGTMKRSRDCSIITMDESEKLRLTTSSTMVTNGALIGRLLAIFWRHTTSLSVNALGSLVCGATKTCESMVEINFRKYAEWSER